MQTHGNRFSIAQVIFDSAMVHASSSQPNIMLRTCVTATHTSNVLFVVVVHVDIVSIPSDISSK